MKPNLSYAFCLCYFKQNIRKWKNETVDSAKKYCTINLEILGKAQSSKHLMSIQSLGLSWLTLDSTTQKYTCRDTHAKDRGKYMQKSRRMQLKIMS